MMFDGNISVSLTKDEAKTIRECLRVIVINAQSLNAAMRHVNVLAKDEALEKLTDLSDVLNFEQ